MDDSETTYANWGDLLRALVLQVLSLPLDITKVMGQLNAKLGSSYLDVRVICLRSHTPYIASALKAAESTVSFNMTTPWNKHSYRIWAESPLQEWPDEAQAVTTSRKAGTS